MPGVLNRTARVFNIRAVDKKSKRMYVVHLVPGLNEVNDVHWKAVSTNKYVKGLKAKGHIDFGAKVEDMLLDEAPHAKTISKQQLVPPKVAKSMDLSPEERDQVIN